MNNKIIKLPCHNIVITLINKELDDMSQYWQSGTITSDLKEVCKHCEDSTCEMDCPEYKEYASDRDTDIVADRLEERTEFQKHRLAVSVIESMVLAHAVAGIDVESPAYVEGIETALDALGNNT